MLSRNLYSLYSFIFQHRQNNHWCNESAAIGTVPTDDIKNMIYDSYMLAKTKKKSP